MLHRAARNAYSWWWASHVRTKQSKWLDQNLQDMEEKVEYILKIIDEDGDTFAKRAEMYYRKRPELMNFVEDSFRGYRALAERYDHLSRELQSANRTIASVFPESVHLSMDDDGFDGENLPPAASHFDEFNQFSKNPPPAPEMSIPKNPSVAKKMRRMPSRLMSKKGLLKINADDVAVSVPVSGLSKSEALEKIDKLQKEILVLQTEKEFVKSSYECSLEKYWHFEKQTTELQAQVSNLQDEFGIGTVIEDEEARTLMTATALKSCQESLTRLQEKQEQSAKEARVEFQKIQEVREKFSSLKRIFECDDHAHQKEHLQENKTASKLTEDNNLDQEMDSSKQNHHNVESLRKRIKEELQVNLGTSLTMSELAEKVDELVDKIINLESAVSSQSALVKRLRSEANDLHTHFQSLEEEKVSLVEGSRGMSNKLRDLEEELHRVQTLNQCIKEKSNHLQTHFIEASCNLDDLSEKLLDVKPDEEAANTIPLSQDADFLGANPVEQIQLHEMTTTQKAQVVSQDVNISEAANHCKVEELKSPVRTSSSNHNADLLQDRDNPGTKAELNKDLLSNQRKNQRLVDTEELFEEPIDAIGPGPSGYGSMIMKDTVLQQEEMKHNLGNSSTCEKGKDKRHSQSSKHCNIDHLLTPLDANPQKMSSQNENVIASGNDIENLQDARMRLKGKQDDVLQLSNEVIKGPTRDVHAERSERKFEQVANVRAPHHNLSLEGHMNVDPDINDLGFSNSKNQIDSHSLKGQERDLLDAHSEKSDNNLDKVVPGTKPQMEGEILGHSNIQSSAQNHSRSSEREFSSDHSSFFNNNRAMEEENDDIHANLSPAKSNSKSEDSSLNNLPHLEGESISEASVIIEGIRVPEISTVSGDLEIVQNPKKHSLSDQGKGREPKQQNVYETMEPEFHRDQDELGVEEDDQLNWKELFLSGLDDKEKLLLQEYTSILRNYKEARKKLNEVEKKKRASLFQYCIQIKVLKSANASKDEKIQSLEKKLNLVEGNQDGILHSGDSRATASFYAPDDDKSLSADQKAVPDLSHDHGATSDSIDAAEGSKISFIEDDGGIKVINIDKAHNPSIVEERIRTDIDELLEENIELWMKFSTSFHQIPKFQTTVQDLRAELANVKEINRQIGNTNRQPHISDIRPIYRHLSEIQTELTLWLDQNSLLNDDLENRLSSLSSIQEEITRLSNAGSRAEETELSEYQAAKFHGEVLNMKHENKKVANELQLGKQRAKILLVEIERTLKQLDADFGICTRKQQTTNQTTRSRIPLRTFLFGVKLKKQKPSLFACITPSLQKQYSDLTALQL